MSMRRPEAEFVSPLSQSTAVSLGLAVRAARLARNLTQRDLAERSRMSRATLIRIERGDAAVSLGAWLSALESTALLGLLQSAAQPESDTVGRARRNDQLRKRATGSRTIVSREEEYDF